MTELIKCTARDCVEFNKHGDRIGKSHRIRTVGGWVLYDRAQLVRGFEKDRIKLSRYRKGRWSSLRYVDLDTQVELIPGSQVVIATDKKAKDQKLDNKEVFGEHESYIKVNLTGGNVLEIRLAKRVPAGKVEALNQIWKLFLEMVTEESEDKEQETVDASL